MQCGGLKPLLKLLESKHYNLQHNAAFALYGLADHEDNVPEIIRQGGLLKLHVSGWPHAAALMHGGSLHIAPCLTSRGTAVSVIRSDFRVCVCLQRP